MTERTERTVKSTESGKDLKQTDKIVSEREREVVNDVKSTPEPFSLAILRNSLQFGKKPPLSAEQSLEAAGVLGNQNVISLMEKGAGVRRVIEAGNSTVDTQGLAEVLSGPPDGPVNAMETIM